MARRTIEAKNTMEALLGKKWFDNNVLEDAMAAMKKVTLTLPSIDPLWLMITRTSRLALRYPVVCRPTIKRSHSPSCSVSGMRWLRNWSLELRSSKSIRRLLRRFIAVSTMDPGTMTTRMSRGL